MKINTILAVALIASASQAVASSALTKFSPHVSRTALLATAAAGHKYAHPICVQKRNLSFEQHAQCFVFGLAGAGGSALGTHMTIGDPTRTATAAIIAFPIFYACTVFNMKQEEKRHLEEKVRKMELIDQGKDIVIKSLNQQLATKNKKTR